MDSTGIKSEGEGEWNARKHGGPKRRLWRKIHIGIDEETLEVRAVEVTTTNVGDAPILPELLDQIADDQDIRSMTVDGAYDTRKCHDAIAARGTHAVIPPRKNVKPWKPTSAVAIARNESVNASQYLGHTIWRPRLGHHLVMPCRAADALCETFGAEPHGPGLRPAVGPVALLCRPPPTDA